MLLGRYTSLFANLHLLRANFEYYIAVPALLAVENLFIAFSYGFRAQNICANEFRVRKKVRYYSAGCQEELS